MSLFAISSVRARSAVEVPGTVFAVLEMKSLELSELLKAAILRQQVAFYVVSVYFGGGRIGTCHLPHHIDGVFFGGGGTGPPPHNVGELTDDEFHLVSRRGLKHVSRRGLKHVPASDQCESQTSIALGNARCCALCQW